MFSFESITKYMTDCDTETYKIPVRSLELPLHCSHVTLPYSSSHNKSQEISLFCLSDIPV